MHHMLTLTPLTAFTFGLLGSIAHCVGMCSGVLLLLGRAGVQTPRERLAAHAGRLTTYLMLGVAGGALGRTLTALLANRTLQSGLALFLGFALAYTALALLGMTPPPETAFPALSALWRRVAHRRLHAPQRGVIAAWGIGLIWGMLPCGFVYSMVLAATASGSPLSGGVIALAFGLGTIPALEGTRALMAHGVGRMRRFAHVLAAALLLLIAGQLILRGLAWWGVIGHGHLGGIMVW